MKSLKHSLRLFLFLFITCFTISCSSEDYGDIPDCIEDVINTFKKDACDENASVILYEFQGVDTYVMDIGLCFSDAVLSVISEECTSLGVLGGIGGLTEINGEIFFENATLIRTVWEN